jgi:acetylornithine deacetylase/succinyl-diaminopimelate desuccinylase-like protein
MDVDLRSSSEQELLRLDSFFRRCVREATDEENQARRRSSPPLSLNVLLSGERPAGETAADSVLVELALEATRASGVTPQLDQSSTDSNLPMSMGIPAITVGAGGNSSGSHTLEEWYDPSDRHLGLKRALLTILGVVGVERRTA